MGWYKYGTKPGDKGSAVIAGHVDNGLALPGVFKNLGDLKKGDDVYIHTTDDNSPIHFLVTETAVYDYNAKVSSVFNENKAPILRLITCTGTFVRKYGTHDKRLVVTAVRADRLKTIPNENQLSRR